MHAGTRKRSKGVVWGKRIYRVFVILIVLVFILSSISSDELPGYGREERFRRFLAKYPGKWKVKWNEDTDTPHRITGGSIAIKEKLNSRNIEKITRKFISENEYILGVKSDYIVLAKADYDKPIREKRGEGTWYVYYWQHYDGVPVYNGSVRLVIKNQQIILIGSDCYPIPKIKTKPEITKGQAVSVVNNDLGLEKPLRALKTKFIIFPDKRVEIIKYHLAWKVTMPSIEDLTIETILIEGKEITFEKPWKAWVYFVNAHTGRIISRYDSMKYDTISGEVWGKIYETTPDVPQVDVPVAHQYIDILQGGEVVETLTTDIDGYYTSSDALTGDIEIEAHLKGPHVEVDNKETNPDATYSAGPITLPVADHIWNWGDPDNDYDSSPHDVETHAFYHTNFIHDWYLRDDPWDPGQEGGPFNIQPDPYPMQVRVRMGVYCNAGASDSGIEFSSGNPAKPCMDLALSSDIIYHEFTHRIVQKVYDIANNGAPDTAFFDAINEGWADYFPCSIADDHMYGEVVTGGRNIDTGEYIGLVPEDGNRRLSRDWIGEEHYDGLIFSGALWDTRKELGAEYTDDIAMRAMKGAGITFSEYLKNLLLADDDDNNLDNGTPNIDVICRVFYDNHGIFCMACLDHIDLPVATITFPDLSQFNAFNDTITIIGTAAGSSINDFDHFTVEFQQQYTSGWLDTGMDLTYDGNAEVIDNILAEWDIDDIEDGKEYTIKLTVTDKGGQMSTFITTVYIDKALHDGWPQLPESLISTSAAAADIDPGYAGLEIVVKENNYLYVFHHDGTLVDGEWPLYINSRYSSPAIGDVDPGYPGLEIVVAEIYGNLYVFHNDGTPDPHWPQYTGGSIYSSPALGDIDKDGYLEIVIGSSSRVWLFNHDGSPVLGWPKEINGIIKSCPALGDIDNDGELEIVAGSDDGYVYALKYNGTPVQDWPQPAGGNEVLSSPALGDIDNNGDLEIAVGSGNYSKIDGVDTPTGPGDFMYVWNHDGSLYGNPVPCWPRETDNFINYPSPSLANMDADEDLEIVIMSNGFTVYAWNPDGTPCFSTELASYWDHQCQSPAIGDIDGDNGLEIITGSHILYALHHDGEVLEGWLKNRNNNSQSSPLLSDIDSDGLVELVCGGQGIYIWDLEGVYNADTMEWPKFHHDIWNTGLYGFEIPDSLAIYVDGSTGNDNYDGSSPVFEGGNAGPKATIQAGVDATPADGICSVAAGIYQEAIVMKDGVILQGAGPGETIIDGGGIGNVITIGAIDIPSTNAVIRGFTITNGRSYGDNTGIRVQNSPASIISNNLITGNGHDGIRVYAGMPTIINNTITKNGRNGIVVHSGAHPVIKNNIIAENTSAWTTPQYGWGIYADNNAVVDSSYNNVWNNNYNYGSDETGTAQPGAGDLSVDPEFVDPDNDDFHLQAGSPCINSGIDVGLPYFSAAPDMGAFEYIE